MSANEGRLSQMIVAGSGDGIRDSFDPQLLRAFDVAHQSIPPELVDPDRVKLNKTRLRLSGDGVFFSVQGEGHTMGLPAVFLRLHVCNLRCVWCDAYYTWNPKSKEFWTESYELTSSEVAEQVKSAWGCKTDEISRRLVITGGEPLLQKNLLDDLIDRLPGWSIEIETNGTIMPTNLQLRTCQFNCSPKLRNSQCSESARIRPEVLRKINSVNSQFKFVVMKAEEIEEIESQFLPFIDRAKIVLMPQGVTESEVAENARAVIEGAKAAGFRLLGRLHVSIWGAKRRV